MSWIGDLLGPDRNSDDPTVGASNGDGATALTEIDSYGERRRNYRAVTSLRNAMGRST
jgi:hypothetical protein